MRGPTPLSEQEHGCRRPRIPPEPPVQRRYPGRLGGACVNSARKVIQVSGRMVIHSGATIPADVLGADSFVDQVRSVFCGGSGRKRRAS